MQPGEYAPISTAWLDYDSADADRVWHEAFRKLISDPAWSEWLREHIHLESSPGSPFHYLQFDDRSKRRIMVKGENVYFYEPGAAAQAAEDRGELLPYFIELLEAFYRRYAEKTGRNAPPPSILS